MITVLLNEIPLQAIPYHNSQHKAIEVMRLRFSDYEYIGEDDKEQYSLYQRRSNKSIIAIY